VNDSQIRAAMARAERATKGRWECVDGNSPHPDWAAYVVDDSPSDWDFVRNARTDIPALCRELLAAREALMLIVHRCDELETRDHDAIDYAEIIGLRETAQAALAAGREKP